MSRESYCECYGSKEETKKTFEIWNLKGTSTLSQKETTGISTTHNEEKGH